jgi:hypothetical protein
MQCEHDRRERGGWINLAGLARLFRILRLVVRGYLTGQPIDEERPRKGCC